MAAGLARGEFRAGETGLAFADVSSFEAPRELLPEGVPWDAFSPASMRRRMASPRLRMRFAKAQSSSAFTLLGVIIVVMRSVFISAITVADDRNGRDDLQDALAAIHGIADVMTEMGKYREANAVAHLAGTLQEASDQAHDAFARIYGLDEYRNPKASEAAATAAEPEPERDGTVPTLRKAQQAYVNFVAEVMHLRALHNTREARNNINFHGLEAFGQPEPPEFGELTEKYEALMREWAEQRPESAEGIHAYIDLAQAIIGDEILNNAREGGGCAIVSGQRDLSYALALLTSAQRWIDDAAINEMIARKRAEREAKP